jgi:hypothetical protein
MLSPQTIEQEWSRIRWNWKDAQAWAFSQSSAQECHLTCVPTLTGFSGGPAQFAAFAASNFPDPATWRRFNNQCRPLNLAYAWRGTEEVVVLEEAWVQLLHGERLDWLLPRQPATNKELGFMVVISATLSVHANALYCREVRLTWDAMTLWTQSGLLADLLRTAARRAGPVEDLLEQLPSCDPRKLRVRLEHPNLHNVQALHQANNNASLNPIMQKSTETFLSMEEDPPTDGVKSPTRRHPALTSDYFSSPEEPKPTISPARSHPALQSQLNLGTQADLLLPPSTPIPSSKLHYASSQRNVLFADSPMVLKPRPSIQLDPAKPSLTSSLVAPEQDKPIVSVVPSLDVGRFQSTWGGDDHQDPKLLEAWGDNLPTLKILNPRRFESHIFDSQEPMESRAVPPQLQTSLVSPADDDGRQGNVPLGGLTTMRMDPNRLASHALGYYMDGAADQSEPRPFIRKQANVSTVMLGTEDPDSPFANGSNNFSGNSHYNHRQHYSHQQQQSQLHFDFDDPQRPPPLSSARYHCQLIDHFSAK